MVHPPPPAFAFRLRRGFDKCHPLTLDGLFEITHCCALPNACCACTHYLVFKEPATAPRLRRFRHNPRRSPPAALSNNFRGTLRGYYPRLSLSITFCSKPNRHGVRQKDVHLCCCVEVERPISHCRAGTRQTNSVRIQASGLDVNRGQSGPGNCHVFPYESRRADRQRLRTTEGGVSRRRSGVR